MIHPTSRRGLPFVWLVLLIALFGARALAASGTIVFTSASGWSAVAEDGQGGSSDISGITIQITNGNNYNRTYETPYSARSSIAAGYADGPSPVITIKSSDQAVNFNFKSIFLADYGGVPVKLTAYDNGMSRGSVNISFPPWEATFDQSNALTPAIFENVDEVQITQESGSQMWIALNNVQIDNPVLPSPTVTSARANQVVATANEIAATTQITGAFTLSNGTKDAAVVITLSPGAYTAQVSSATGTTGIALVEIYEIPE